MKLVPISDRIVVERVERESMTEGGIVIQDSADDQPVEAKVLSVGPGKRHNGEVVAPDVKKGDRILHRRRAGTEIKLKDHNYLVLREDDILARISD